MNIGNGVNGTLDRSRVIHAAGGLILAADIARVGIVTIPPQIGLDQSGTIRRPVADPADSMLIGCPAIIFDCFINRRVLAGLGINDRLRHHLACRPVDVTPFLVQRFIGKIDQAGAGWIGRHRIHLKREALQKQGNNQKAGQDIRHTFFHGRLGPFRYYNKRINTMRKLIS